MSKNDDIYMYLLLLINIIIVIVNTTYLDIIKWKEQTKNKQQQNKYTKKKPKTNIQKAKQNKT